MRRRIELRRECVVTLTVLATQQPGRIVSPAAAAPDQELLAALAISPFR